MELSLFQTWRILYGHYLNNSWTDLQTEQCVWLNTKLHVSIFFSLSFPSFIAVNSTILSRTMRLIRKFEYCTALLSKRIQNSLLRNYLTEKELAILCFKLIESDRWLCFSIQQYSWTLIIHVNLKLRVILNDVLSERKKLMYSASRCLSSYLKEIQYHKNVRVIPLTLYPIALYLLLLQLYRLHEIILKWSFQALLERHTFIYSG